MVGAYCNVSELLGKTLSDILINEDRDEIRFVCTDGTIYLMYHEQDCCETVSIEDISGELDRLIGSPIIMAEDISNELEIQAGMTKWSDTYTWTYYKFATVKGYLTIRWYGESNGYYSESVEFKRLEVKHEW